MFVPFVSARSRKSLVSSLALALALAGGVAVSSAAFVPAAHAQSYSREFRGAYAPVANLTQGEMPNWAAARDQFETIVAAIKNEDDRNAAGNFALQIGNNLSDKRFQRRGLEMMLQSGKVAPEQVGMFNFFVGNLAYEAGDYAAARTALLAAVAAGYTENDPRGLILGSYFEQNQPAEGIAYLQSLAAGGGAVPENLLLVGLQNAYDANLITESNQLSLLLVQQHPTEENWVRSTQVVNAINALDPQAQLDLFRLMRETNALTQRAEYIRYIENADPRIMSNEVLPVLQLAVDAGELATTDDYYREVKSIADARAPQDRRELEALVREGRAGDARAALSTGDLLWSVADYARAEELYQAALDKGADRDTALTRLGMTQVKQGKFADAVATLGQVGGARAPVAQMWAAYAQSQIG